MKPKAYIITLPFLFYFFTWIFLHAFVSESVYYDYFTDTYGLLAGLGAVLGFHTAKRWGSFKSYVGKSVIFFSFGLLAQFLGQLSYTILFYVYHVENAYPAFGEIFYLLSIPFYLVGTYFIAKASGIHYTLKNVFNKIWLFIIPVLMVSISYSLFLRNYDFTDVPFVNVFLDFFYPIGQALFVSAALIVYATTYDILGGVMKMRVRLILFSLLFQYIADSMFIYETINETWVPGGLSDLVFVASYFLMAISLIWLDDVEKE